MWEIRDLWLQEIIDVANEKLEPNTAEKWGWSRKQVEAERRRRFDGLDIKVERRRVVDCLNAEWTQRQVLWGFRPWDGDPLSKSFAVRRKLGTSDVAIAVVLREMGRHARRVRDVDHVMWIDQMVLSWGLAVAGNEKMLKAIRDLPKELADKRHKDTNTAKGEYRAAAKAIWDKDPTMTIKGVIDALPSPKVPAKSPTRRNWIKDIAPNRKPGRRKKEKNK